MDLESGHKMCLTQWFTAFSQGEGTRTATDFAVLGGRWWKAVSPAQNFWGSHPNTVPVCNQEQVYIFPFSWQLTNPHCFCELPKWVSCKNPPASKRDQGSIPGLGRCPGGGNGYTLQYSSLENPVDRGAWWATVHGVAKSWTWLSNWAHSHSVPMAETVIHLPKGGILSHFHCDSDLFSEKWHRKMILPHHSFPGRKTELTSETEIIKFWEVSIVSLNGSYFCIWILW